MTTLTGASVRITASDSEMLQGLRSLANADTTPLMHRLGQYFQSSTQKRFTSQTNPQGESWAPLSPGYLKRKKKNQTLVLTFDAYLRRGIHYQVLAPTSVAWGSNSIYAAIHNWGGDGTGHNGSMPQRQFAGVSADDNAEVLAIVQDWLYRKLNGQPD